MRRAASVAVLISALVFCKPISGQQTEESVVPMTLGLVTISKSVIQTGGERLVPGNYEVRLTGASRDPVLSGRRSRRTISFAFGLTRGRHTV